MNSQERNRLIDALIENDISEADFLRLEAELSVDPAARREYYNRLGLSAALEAEAGAAPEIGRKIVVLPAPTARWFPAFAAMAAVFLALLSVIGVLWQKRPVGSSASPGMESKASGFAVIAGQAAALWADGLILADGALLPAGPLHLASGVAHIELFSGVTAIIEGEAEFEIMSPMEMKVARGKVRARVPEPAQGFRIHTAEGEIVDLGTEFALNFSSERSEVHVLDGEVEWHPRTAPMRRMEKGEALSWNATGQVSLLTANAAGFIGLAELRETLSVTRQARHGDWHRFSQNLRLDPRLVAYYHMGTPDNVKRRLSNQSVGAASEGAIVAAARVTDRWGTPGGALDFSPTGSRVRVNVPGEYRSLTLLTWVKINSLDRWYNSLFLTDGAKLNQPHWQIMDDGRLFFSVKKRERSEVKKGQTDKHHFMSPPIWNASLSGQWQMIATTYDVEALKVTHYLNGQPLSEEAIPGDYLVETVTIGAASICNWSEPAYRTDAHFAVRNLNGSMDELAIFAAALTPREIADIYEHGKP